MLVTILIVAGIIALILLGIYLCNKPLAPSRPMGI